LLIVGLLDGATILFGLSSATIQRGVVLGTVAFVYLVTNLAFSKVWRIVPCKEIATGFLFAAGVLLPWWPGGVLGNSGLFFPALLFGCVCSLNCLSIAVWERELDEKQGKHSFATRWPGAASFVRFGCGLTVLACLSGLFFRRAWPVASCLAASSGFLFALHFLPIPRHERTAAADLVLLTPLLMLAGERFL
jgi:hypothetical protein